MATQANGTFDVKLAPQTLEDDAEGTFYEFEYTKECACRAGAG